MQGLGSWGIPQVTSGKHSTLPGHLIFRVRTQILPGGGGAGAKCCRYRAKLQAWQQGLQVPVFLWLPTPCYLIFTQLQNSTNIP